MPTEPESAKPEEESSRRGGGGEKSSSLKPPKCAVCTSHKKGVCGTATAPLKCARRRENDKEKASSSDLPRLDAAAPKWDVAADGPPPAPAAEELKKLERFFKDAESGEAFAPDDEIVGELLQAHAALARASWIARSLAAKALLRARDAGYAAERAAREEKEKWVEETSRYEERWRGGKWREEYLRRRGLPSADDGGEALADAFGDHSRELVDPLVETGAMEDALCAVCGGGDSEAPNEIVFCERCELAVHQDCYGVAEVPEGDWLCWPCHVAEANENEQGLPPSRPPRWLREAGDGALYDPRPACVLCPVRRGALRAVTEPHQPEKSAPTEFAGMSAGEALIPTKDSSDCPSPGPGPGPDAGPAARYVREDGFRGARVRRERFGRGTGARGARERGEDPRRHGSRSVSGVGFFFFFFASRRMDSYAAITGWSTRTTLAPDMPGTRLFANLSDSSTPSRRRRTYHPSSRSSVSCVRWRAPADLIPSGTSVTPSSSSFVLPYSFSPVPSVTLYRCHGQDRHGLPPTSSMSPAASGPPAW
uniref:PHD-type domain-containing protein n=1 Tax=Micromonas pusilla TaxID=38833 RepID=A0A7S0CYF8_MICPS